MENIIVIAIVAVIVALASLYIYKAKKSGKKCIGCPANCSCSGKENNKANGCSGNCCGCSGCGGSSEAE